MASVDSLLVLDLKGLRRKVKSIWFWSKSSDKYSIAVQDSFWARRLLDIAVLCNF